MRRWLPLLMVAAISGCGSSSSATTSSSTTATSPAAKAPAKAPRHKTVQTVSIKNFDYHPTTLTVTAGTTVRWANEDASNHTVTGEGGAKIKLGNVDQGRHVQMRFTTSGTYRYYCEYHPNMHARIVVR